MTSDKITTDHICTLLEKQRNQNAINNASYVNHGELFQPVYIIVINSSSSTSSRSSIPDGPKCHHFIHLRRALTSSNINRCSKFFHSHNQEKNCLAFCVICNRVHATRDNCISNSNSNSNTRLLFLQQMAGLNTEHIKTSHNKT